MPTTAPRTHTGLVPTTHHNKLNRRNSTENWTPLPPRPPPERFPYRGDKTPNSKSSTKRSNSIRKSHAKSKRKKKGATSTEWNDSTLQSGDDGEETYRWNSEKGETKENGKLQSLDYVRNSARKRTQLNDLQTRLDFEIQKEDELYGTRRSSFNSPGNDEGMVEEVDHNNNFAREKSNPLLKEVNRIKVALLSRLEDIEVDGSSDESRDFGCDENDTKKVETSYFTGAPFTDYREDTISGNNAPDTFQYSFGDASTLQTIDSTTSVEGEAMTVSSKRDDFKPFSNSIFTDESSGGVTTPSFSTTSTWDNLSSNQHDRIYNRAQDLYKLKYKPQQEVNMSLIDDENKDKRAKKKDFTIGPLKDISANNFSEDSSCVKGLVDAISEGLFLTKLEMANDGGDVAKPQASSPGPSGEISAPPKQIKASPGPSDKVLAPPNQIPAPRHAYGLPLETKFRKAMRKDASMR